jgi:predicted Kef-type K+ transport protein
LLSLGIVAALILGALSRQIGLPPLVGFLACGFLLRALGVQSAGILPELAEAGVLLLLFSVGLKVRFKTVIRSEVWGTATAHMLVVGALALLILIIVLDYALGPAAALALALTFSSTVFAAKALDTQYELRSVHGRLSIGILIVQDLVAVAALAVLAARTPSPAAVVLLALPMLRPAITRVLDVVGHGELLVLFGIAAAVALGGAGFEHLGLSPELGALLVGALFADHRRAQELSDAVWGLKEFMLVGFFLSIGLNAELSPEALQIAGLLLVLLPIKAAMFFLLLVAFGLRARTSFLTALSLATFSEFALIIANGAVNQGLIETQWLVAIAVAVAVSFAIAAAFNTHEHEIYAALSPWLEVFERDQPHPDDEPISLGSAEILIVGMGRLGSGAYDYLQERGKHIVGADDDPGKLEQNRRAGRRVVYADAEDPSFWSRLNLGRIRLIMLTLPDPHAKHIAARALRARGYAGFLSATFVYPEEKPGLIEAGCDVAYNYYTEAGVGFARDTVDMIEGGR